MGVELPLMYIIGGIFAVMSMIIATWHVGQHMRNFAQPQYQKYICRILLMVPIYALTSWFSMILPQHRLMIDTTRDCYEAFVLYSFVMLLIEYCGGDRKLVIRFEMKERISHPFPFNFCFAKFRATQGFLRFVKGGMLQFVIIRPMASIAALILDATSLYHENYYGLDDGFLYVFMVNNVSFSVALYALVLFFISTEEILERFRPYPKFICVKLVIFFSFWQGILLFLLVKLDYLHGSKHFNSEHMAITIQEFLICIEMFIASIAHKLAFDYTQYEEEDPEGKPIIDEKRNLFSDIQDVLLARDVVNGVKHTFQPEINDFELNKQTKV